MNIPKPDILNNYLRHVEINSYLAYLENRYKSFVSVYTIGNSYEGRAIKAIKIDLLKDEKYMIKFRKLQKENIYNKIESTPPVQQQQQQQQKQQLQLEKQKPDKENKKKKNNKNQLNSKKNCKRKSLKFVSDVTSTSDQSSLAVTDRLQLQQNLNLQPILKPILKVRISKSNVQNQEDNSNNKRKIPKRKWIIIEGGTHAREWTSITVALYCIHQLTEKFCRNIEILQKAKFLIIPLVNGDGYEYSRNKNRHWRKNRKPSATSRSIGTDCNRNYDINWEHGTKTTSKCTYRGDMPFSEPETRAIKNVLERLGPNIIFFVSLHSCAQSIMYPWGYTRELPETWSKLQKIAENGKQAIQKATGRKYRCGSISQVTNRTYSGSIVDYAFAIHNVPYTFVIELPSKKLGFQPPRDKIQQIGEESWIGIKAMCQSVFENKERIEARYRFSGTLQVTESSVERQKRPIHK